MLKKLTNHRGFTLIEMLIVLLVISVLIILIVPNLGNRSADVHDTGCEALVSLVQAQADAYHIEKGRFPSSISELVSEQYITEDQTTCPNNDRLEMRNGTVSAG